MEEYLQYMRNLRTQMNDVEDQAAKISVEEQMQITTIHTLEKDLNLAKSETKRVVEETNEMVKSRGEICSKILDKQKRMASLESDSLNLSQTLELIQQERNNSSAKLLERSSYYARVAENMVAGLNEQKCWLDNKLQHEIPEESNMQTDLTEEISNKEDLEKEHLLSKLHAAEAKLEEIIHIKTRLITENSEMKQSIEKIKCETNDLKPELSTMEMITLEEEHKALLSEHSGEIEYMESLKSQIEKLREISHVIKCACGGELKVEMGLSEVAL